MKLDFNLQVTQKQGLALTAQVQQAIKLLQMTNLEVSEFVEEQFQDNPFVEESAFAEKIKSQQSEERKSQGVDQSLENAPYQSTSDETKMSRDNQFETGESYIPRSTVSKATNDFDAMTLVAEKQKSLYTHCNDYLNKLRLDALETLIANSLIENLEPTGWLGCDLEDIAKFHDIDVEAVENVLTQLQEIEPAGLFARTLKECLVLQATDRGLLCENMAIILDNLHLMGSGKFDLLKRRSGCSETEIAQIFKKIKSFNPKPGLTFEETEAPIREPDLHVRKGDIDGAILR